MHSLLTEVPRDFGEGWKVRLAGRTTPSWRGSVLEKS